MLQLDVGRSVTNGWATNVTEAELPAEMARGEGSGTARLKWFFSL